jgi:hypothetical protein
MCTVGSESITAPLCSINATYFRWSFVTANSSVAPDTPTDLILNLNTCYRWWAPRTRIIRNIRPLSFKYSYTFTDFTVDDMVVTILNFHYSINIMGYHTIWWKKIGSSTVVLPWHIILNAEPHSVTELLLFRREWKQTSCKKVNVHSVYIRHLFSATNISLEGNNVALNFDSLIILFRYALQVMGSWIKHYYVWYYLKILKSWRFCSVLASTLHWQTCCWGLFFLKASACRHGFF